MTRTVTTSELAALVAPFVDAKLNPKAHPHHTSGGYLQAKRAIDIYHRSVSVRADVRSVGPEGVEVFFYKGCDLIPWSAISKIVIVGLDPDGNRIGETEFEHVGQRELAA